MEAKYLSKYILNGVNEHLLSLISVCLQVSVFCMIEKSKLHDSWMQRIVQDTQATISKEILMMEMTKIQIIVVLYT